MQLKEALCKGQYKFLQGQEHKMILKQGNKTLRNLVTLAEYGIKDKDKLHVSMRRDIEEEVKYEISYKVLKDDQ